MSPIKVSPPLMSTADVCVRVEYSTVICLCFLKSWVFMLTKPQEDGARIMEEKVLRRMVWIGTCLPRDGVLYLCMKNGQRERAEDCLSTLTTQRVGVINVQKCEQRDLILGILLLCLVGPNNSECPRTF